MLLSLKSGDWNEREWVGSTYTLAERRTTLFPFRRQWIFVIIVTTFHNQWDQNLCQLSCCLLAAIAALSAASFVMLLHLAASCNWILIKMRAKTPTREVLVGPVRTWPSSRPLWNRTKSCPDFLIVVLLLIFFLYFFHFLFRLLGLQTRPRAPLKNVDKCWQFFRQPLVINLIFLWPWPG